MAKTITIIIVLLCSLFAIPQAVLYGIRYRPTSYPEIRGQECNISEEYTHSPWPIAFAGFMMLLFLAVYIPLIVLYVLVGLQAWRHSQLHGVPVLSNTATTSETTLSGTFDIEGNTYATKERFSRLRYFLSEKCIYFRNFTNTQLNLASDSNAEYGEGVKLSKLSSLNEDNMKVYGKDKHLTKKPSLERSASQEGMNSDSGRSELFTPRDREMTQHPIIKVNCDCDYGKGSLGQPNPKVIHYDHQKSDCDNKNISTKRLAGDQDEPPPDRILGQNDRTGRCLFKLSVSTMDGNDADRSGQSFGDGKYINSISTLDDGTNYDNEYSKKRNQVQYQQSYTGFSITHEDTDRVQQYSGQSGARNRFKSKQHSPKKNQTRRVLTRTTLMLSIITAVYVIAFLPYLILVSVKFSTPTFYDNLSPVGESFYNIFLRFYFINSAANALIYSICDARFRTEVLKLFKLKKN